jgi:hypothetical protein
MLEARGGNVQVTISVSEIRVKQHIVAVSIRKEGSDIMSTE